MLRKWKRVVNSSMFEFLSFSIDTGIERADKVLSMRALFKIYCSSALFNIVRNKINGFALMGLDSSAPRKVLLYLDGSEGSNCSV